MKLRFLGTGTFGAKTRGLTSFLIDDEILFDCGNGTIRALQDMKFDLSKIKTIIITHFHIDHVADLSYYIAKHKVNELATTPAIISPKGLKEMLFHEIRRHDMSRIAEHSQSAMNYIETDGSEIAIDGYKITSRQVVHSEDLLCLGYEINGIGFSGDSAKCEGLNKIVANCSTILIDSTRPGESNEEHLNLSGALEYATDNPSKKFYLVHRSDYEPSELSNNIYIPNDGDTVEL